MSRRRSRTGWATCLRWGCSGCRGRRSSPANEAWLNTTLIALTLTASAQLIGFDGELNNAEPDTFRTRILHIAGQTATRARQLILHLDAQWPWTTQAVAGYQRIPHAFTVT